MADKCHQQLCTNAAQPAMCCTECGNDYCDIHHLTWHATDNHSDRGLITRGKMTPPALSSEGK